MTDKPPERQEGWTCPDCQKFVHWGSAHRCPNTPYISVKHAPVERPPKKDTEKVPA